MYLKSITLSVVLSLTFSYGAVVPLQEDALFDMVQSFLLKPDEFAPSLGMTRVKRSAFDQDFKHDALGLQVQIKYLDPNNPLRGGKAIVNIDDFGKFYKNVQGLVVKLDIDFDSGSNPKDGLFKMNVDYELKHYNLEKGTLHIERKKDGNLWKTDISTKCTNDAEQKLVPELKFSAKSDHKNMLEGSYEDYKKLTFKIDRTPGKKIHGEINASGMTYIIDGVLDKAQKKVQINVDANGMKYKIDLDMDDSGDSYDFKAIANLGRLRTWNVEVDAKKDMTAAGLKLFIDGDNYINIKLVGKADPAKENLKYEARYSVARLGDGKLRVSLKGGDNKELKAQYLPSSGLDVKLQITRELKSDSSRHLDAQITRGGETYLHYKNDIVPTYSADSYELKMDSQFDISEKSMFYPALCNYGCFKTRTMHSKLYVEKAKMYKFSLDVELTKDGSKVLNMEVNSRNNPYIFKINAPRMLPKILSTGQESIEFEADHNPGQYLKIKSNTNVLKSFKIEKMAGDMRRVELNGKELVKAGFSKADNSISQTTTLPDGRSLTTTISWKSDNLKKNKVNVKLDGTERKLNADLDWDVTNPAAIKIKVDAKGENPRWGKYELMRDIKMSSAGSKLNAEWTGNSVFANAPWPSPVKTDVKCSVDINTKDYSLMVKKNVAGTSYGVTLQNGKLSVNI